MSLHKSGKQGSGLVKRVPVYQSAMDSNPLKGDITHAGKGKLVQQIPSFQASMNKNMIGDVHVGAKTSKAHAGSMKDVQRITQKAGLTNQGYGI